MTSWVIFDLDGVLASTRGRSLFLKKKDWNSFHEAGTEAASIKNNVTLLKQFAANQHIKIAVITGRGKHWHDKTLTWFRRRQINVDELYMRGETDRRPAPEFKKDIMVEKFRKRDVIFIVDDDPRNVEMFNQLGYSAMLYRNPDEHDS